ncbi:protein spaetzle 5 isoform X1 [Schistocerca cancellata]|uniref:protein spaetzle 5 isoform X1 n=1 Tax=Schistocerca cancellata TaxID=274614 RepID=UPI002117E4D8|nr:protein spaetzle 5 isoform X1 [Schistocerca cancellata]
MPTSAGHLATVLGVLLAATPLASSPQCDHYGGCRSYPFLPAPPGKTPSCAKPGATFCEKIDHYPTQLIRYLIEQWAYDYNTLLLDESRDDFNYSKRDAAPAARRPAPPPPPPYGPPPRGYPYGPVPALSYLPLQLVTPAGPGNGSGPYPDRRYKLLATPYLYTTALLQPAHVPVPVAHYEPPPPPPPPAPHEWWARYARSNSKAEATATSPGAGSSSSSSTSRNNAGRSGSRSRRQSGSGSQDQLCPTTKQFVMPKAAMNNQGNWMYVVNLNEVDDRYTQLVGTETCVSNQCNGLCTIPNGYTSRCQQQYVQKKLVALEGSGNQLYEDFFWFPHCCVCQITQNG